VEVCPESGVIVQKLANRIAEDGGAALIVDYGHDGTKTDTFRVSAIIFNFLRLSNAYSILNKFVNKISVFISFGSVFFPHFLLLTVYHHAI